MRDEFHFSAPLGFLGRVAEWTFLTRYMTRFLRSRSQALKELAESPDWKRYMPETVESVTPFYVSTH
jgi:hypothetical protein